MEMEAASNNTSFGVGQIWVLNVSLLNLNSWCLNKWEWKAAVMVSGGLSSRES